MQGSFRLGLVLENELQLSCDCFLSRDDNLARFLPSLPDRLYLFGNINVVIPVKIDGKLQQVGFQLKLEFIFLIKVVLNYCLDMSPKRPLYRSQQSSRHHNHVCLPCDVQPRL